MLKTWYFPYYACQWGVLYPPSSLLATLLPDALLRTVATGAGFCGDTRNWVSWCHPLSFDASEAVTALGENYDQMRMETKQKSLHHTLVDFSAGL